MIKEISKTQQLAEQIRKKQRQQYRREIRERFNAEEVTLQSQILQKFHYVAHSQLPHHVHEIKEILSSYNLEQMQEQQHDQLIDDLFYLSYEIPEFEIPRQIQFLKNKSRLTASFVALVSTQITPKQLAYWLLFISQQDRDMVYLGIMDSSFHYQSWVIHPILRSFLLTDFKRIKTAAQSMKQIIGYNQTSPQKMITTKGVTLQNILTQILTIGLEGMMEITLFAEHLEIAIWVLKSQWKTQSVKDLYDVFNKVLIQKAELISDIFVIWALECMVKGYRILSQKNVKFLVDLLKLQSVRFPQIQQKHITQLNNFIDT